MFSVFSQYHKKERLICAPFRLFIFIHIAESIRVFLRIDAKAGVKIIVHCKSTTTAINEHSHADNFLFLLANQDTTHSCTIAQKVSLILRFTTDGGLCIQMIMYDIIIILCVIWKFLRSHTICQFCHIMLKLLRIRDGEFQIHFTIVSAPLICFILIDYIFKRR